LHDKLVEADNLRNEVERLTGEAEVLRGVVEEGLRERRRLGREVSTLVVLSAVPILTLIQGISQSIAGPLFAQERSQTGTAATLIDRAIASIPTVKAFNVVP
jgi:hypothetical protein